MKKIDLNELYDVLTEQVMILKNESTQLDNKQFSRECQKAKEIGNLAGKAVAITAQQLFANQLGAGIAVPGLGIDEGQIQVEHEPTIAKMLGKHDR